MRAVAIAIGAALVTSIIAMLVPVGLWETITGSTGISELIPATGAPLGDTARALIAFSFGLLAFAVTAALLLRKPSAPSAKPVQTKAEPVADAVDVPNFFESMKAKLSDFAASRRSDNIVTELSDLPRLRPGDAHPDAPPRRPISAHRDFADIVPEPEMPVGTAVETPAAAVAIEIVTADPADDVASMVDRLETAVALREQQLAKLEAIAKAGAASQQETVMAAESVEAEIVQPAPRPMTLEAVPSEPAKSSGGKEMDAALRSALETLHRMNARTR
jgi:hypothetical protein